MADDEVDEDFGPEPPGREEAGAAPGDDHVAIAAALDRIEADLDDVAATIARMG